MSEEKIKKISSFGRCLIFLASLSFLAASVSGGSFGNSVERARVLMVEAMKARDDGNPALAKLFFLQARYLQESLPVPVWLSGFVEPSSPQHEQEIFLKLSASLAVNERRSLLEERLAFAPENEVLRRELLEIAEKSGDQVAIQRHRSFLPKNEDAKWLLFKKVATVILYLAIAYNLWAILKKRPIMANRPGVDENLNS